MRLSCLFFTCAAIASLPSAAFAVNFGKVICIGDSITEGKGGLKPAANGYSWRYDFWKQAVDHGDTFSFVGTRTSNNTSAVSYPTYTPTSGPNAGVTQTFVNKHEAIWGTSTSERNTNIGAALNTLATGGDTPDTAFIFVGGNDFTKDATTQTAKVTAATANIKGIIDKLQGQVGGVTGNAKITIHIVSIIPRFTGNSPDPRNAVAFTDFNTSLASLAAAETTTTSKVDMISLFSTMNNPAYYYDGVHPNALGEAALGNGIYSASVSRFQSRRSAACPGPVSAMSRGDGAGVSANKRR